MKEKKESFYDLKLSIWLLNVYYILITEISSSNIYFFVVK